MLKWVGRYEILAELGRGGFGQVFRGLDPQVGRPVAVKTLTADSDPASLTRFKNEAAASGRLRHPNIVTIFDFGEHEGVPYIVMELLEGEDLHHVITNKRPLSMLQKLEIMAEVGAGLGHAHSHGIIHRDVKPANVMLLNDGSSKIMDYPVDAIPRDAARRDHRNGPLHGAGAVPRSGSGRA